MPNTFPAGPPTLSGDTVSISRFLQSPQALQRRLRNYKDLRFVSDQILTQRFRSQGGAVLYEQSEPFVTDRAVEAVGPGSAYPYAKAKAVIVGLNLGYMPDTLVLNDTQYAYLMSDDKFTNALRRETSTNPVYTGTVEVVAGLTIVVSPAIGVAGAMVLDASQLGGMADEVDGSPGYAVSDLAVQVKSIRLDGQDGYDLQGRRKTVPVVQEPGAAVKLTGTVI
jgi:hypothetical protein